MPISVELPSKTIAIDGDIETILKAYDEAIKSFNIGESSGVLVSQTQARPGWWYTKVVSAAEIVTGSTHGSTVRNLPPLAVSLDPPADMLREAYCECLNKLIIKCGLGSADTESLHIENKFILVYHIMIRLVTVALSKDMAGDRDGDLLIKVLENFISRVNSDTSLYDEKWALWKKQLSVFNIFLADTHNQWLTFIKDMVTAVKLFNHNTTAMTESLSHLKETRDFLKRRIIAELNPELETPTDLSANWVNMILGNCEEQVLELARSKRTNAIISFKPKLSALSTKEKSELICEAKKIIKPKAKPTQIAELYDLLNETELLKKAVDRVDAINTAAGWLPFMMGLIRVDRLADHIQKHGEKCSKIKFPSEYITKKIGEGLIRYKAASGHTLQISAIRCQKKLMQLCDPQVLSKITTFIEDILNSLSNLQPELGYDLLDATQLAQLTQKTSSLKSKTKGPIADNNNRQNSLTLGSTNKELQVLEDEIKKIEELLKHEAASLMKKHSNEIRAASKSREPATEAILEWLLGYEKSSIEDLKSVSFLQLRKAKLTSELLSHYKKFTTMQSPSQTITTTLKQRALTLSSVSQSLKDKDGKISDDSKKLVKRDYKEKPMINQLTKKDGIIVCLSITLDNHLICAWNNSGLLTSYGYTELWNNQFEAISTKKRAGATVCVFGFVVLSKNQLLINISEDSFYMEKWDLSSHIPQKINGIKERCLCAFSDDNVITSSHRAIYYRDLNKKNPLNTFNIEHTKAICTAVTLSMNTFATGSDDNTIRIWNKNHVNSLKVLNGHTDTVFVLKKISDNLLASGSEDNTIRIWDIVNWKCKYILSGHTRRINALATADNFLISASDDNTIRIWNYQTGKCEQVIEQHKNPIYGLACFPDGRLVSGDSEGYIYMMTFPELKTALENTLQDEEERSEVRSQFH